MYTKLVSKWPYTQCTKKKNKKSLVHCVLRQTKMLWPTEIHNSLFLCNYHSVLLLTVVLSTHSTAHDWSRCCVDVSHWVVICSCCQHGMKIIAHRRDEDLSSQTAVMMIIADCRDEDHREPWWRSLRTTVMKTIMRTAVTKIITDRRDEDYSHDCVIVLLMVTLKFSCVVSFVVWCLDLHALLC